MVSNGNEEKRKGKKVKSNRSIPVKSTESIEVLFEKFYLAKVAEGRSKGTLGQYRANFKQLLHYLDEKNCPKYIDKITVDVIRDYIIYMREEKIQFVMKLLTQKEHRLYLKNGGKNKLENLIRPISKKNKNYRYYMSVSRSKYRGL